MNKIYLLLEGAGSDGFYYRGVFDSLDQAIKSYFDRLEDEEETTVELAILSHNRPSYALRRDGEQDWIIEAKQVEVLG